MPNARRPPKRIVDYPWNEWMDGEVHHLAWGKDFKVAPSTFRSMVYQKAIEHNLLVQVDNWFGLTNAMSDRGLDVRFYPKPTLEELFG
jgi:hypothetical protein